MEQVDQSPVPSVSPFANPQRLCDIVMKGGITSGVVYPLAVVKLAERYSFKSIGGTSAGAIAAAAAAAAELGRSSGGFERLANLPKFLSAPSPGGKGTNLFNFFQPEDETCKLFRICISALGGGRWAFLRVLVCTVIQFPLATLIGALPALVLLLGAWFRAIGGFFVLCTISAGLLLLVGVLIALTVAVVCKATSALPKNFYGLCSGVNGVSSDCHSASQSKRGQSLTDWLTGYLNELGGRRPEDPPLTFGDLWGTRDPGAERRINLEMMTTCLTHGRPYRLPFRDDEGIRESRRFYFRPDEFRRLFPENVVRWLEKNPREPRDEKAKTLERRKRLKDQGFYPLPEPADLPVVVGVRMSLSFPILLSAIPLHSIEFQRNSDGNSDDQKPERCWFSDGGVCSNFPLHFFDSPLPRWPTFSINLSQKPSGTPPSLLVQPEMVERNEDGIQEHWNRFEFETKCVNAGKSVVTWEKCGLGKLIGFLGSLVTTMQNWSDNSLTRLPGYRDRIAHVGLTPEEGGLNLKMPDNRINDLTKRGAAVGDEFVKRFAIPTSGVRMNWENHRWLRLRTMLACLDQMFGRIERTCSQPQAGDLGYEDWIRNTPPNSGAPSYDWCNRKQHRLALRTVRILRRLSTAWKRSGTLAADDAPRPRPELRPRPQV